MKNELGVAGSSSNGAGVTRAPTERLTEDLRSLSRDASAVISDFGETATAGFQAARGSALEKVSVARSKTQSYVTNHPWQSLAVVGGVGLLLGWLLKRR